MRPSDICQHGLEVVECAAPECDDLLTECDHGVLFTDPDECSMCERDWKELMHRLAESCSPTGDFDEGLGALKEMLDDMEKREHGS